MGSWSLFRRTRVGVFVLITVISLLLTAVYAIFISKDFSRYTLFQRCIVASAAAIHSITAILMYLMLAVRYSAKLDALRIVILLGLHAASTTLFTLKSTNMPCTAFKGGAMCRQVASATAIVAWVLCGLLVVYGACLAIMCCIPQPPPLDLEPELDMQVPVNSQARHVTHLSINSNTRLINPDLEKQIGSAHPLLSSRNGSSGSVEESMRIGRPMPLQRGVQQSASYGSEYPLNVSPTAMRGSDEDLLFWPAGESRRMRSLDESRHYPPSYTSTDPTPRPLALRPGSIYSAGSPASPAPVGFVNGARSATLPPPPLPAQSNAQKAMSRRTRSSSMTNSVYSVASGDSEEFIPPVPSLGAYRTSPGPRFVRPRADSGPWQQLVLDAAAGRRSVHV